jgi:hypothetical protein
MSLADAAIKKSNILNDNDTEILEKAVERIVPEDNFDKWYCGVVENKEEEYVKVGDYFNCWVLKASILSNIEFLRSIKMKLYDITTEHKRLDKRIEELMLRSNTNLEKL